MSTLVLALNPALDVEWRVDEVRWEEKNLVSRERRWAGGKGVNVARWMHFLGGNPRMLLPLGGPIGEEMRECLRRGRIPFKAIAICAETRANVVVSTSSGRQIRFNKAGPKLTSNQWREILAAIASLSKKAQTIVLSGSLPRGASAGAYRRIIQQLPEKRVILDCDGDAFRKGVEAKPFLVKPNEFELSQWVGKSLKSVDSLRAAARKLSQQTGSWVLVSRGSKGAFLLNESEHCFFQAEAPKVAVRNSVGAGDAMLAAVTWQIEQETPPADWLRWGIAAGASAVASEGGILPPLDLIKQMYRQISVR